MKRDDLREHFKSYVGESESPIESMLATALMYEIGMTMFEMSAGEYPVTPICNVQTQVSVDRYRIDIALVGKAVRVAIECDGHDFHEKTKEQAARDKSRDRQICAAGYTVLRFTGSEIWRNPLECAQEAIAIARQQQSDAAEAIYSARCER